MTREEFILLLPDSVSINLTKGDKDSIDSLYDLEDEVDIEVMEDMFLDNIEVMSKARTVAKYVEAVKFVTLKEQYGNKTKAWVKVFREKALKYPVSHHAQYARAYNRGKLVTALEDTAKVAMHVLYSGARHNAVMRLVKLANGKAAASEIPITEEDEYGKQQPVLDEYGKPMFKTVHMVVSPTVQALAAKSVIEATNIPIVQEHKVELGISAEAISAKRQEVNAINDLAKSMHKVLNSGAMNINEVQKVGHLFNADVEEITDINIEE